MKTKTPKKKSALRRPEIIVRNGKPTAVIIPIADYEALLRKLEDEEDLRIVKELREHPSKYRSFEDYMAERESRV